MRRVCLLLLSLLLPVAPRAETSPSPAPVQAQAETPRVQASLLLEAAAVAPGDTVAVLLHQHILPGWHTYWQNPGDSGEPVRLTWLTETGPQEAALQWPVPERIPVGPLVNYGYSGEASLLTRFTLPKTWVAGHPFPVQAEASWLVCEEECIPEAVHFAFTLPTAERTQAASDPRFELARQSLPRSLPWAMQVSRQGKVLLLSLDMPLADSAAVREAYFFAETWGAIQHAERQPLRQDERGLHLRLPLGDLAPSTLPPGVLRIDFIGSKPVTGYQLSSPQKAPPKLPDPIHPAPVDDTPPSLIGALWLALIGGLLLNLMPCVFPVLAMKALHLSQQHGVNTGPRLIGGLTYTAGVLISFAGLGLALLVLKASGAAIGWGFQLQNPVVVGLLALVLFGVGLNFSGVFEAGLRLSTAGHWGQGAKGPVQSFLTGVLAAVVAAPCTAPFMATALGAALVLPNAAALGIFLMLGLGLALPYLLLTAVPALAALLPKPGSWMLRFKQALAFPLYLSAAWLIWVLAQQTGADGVFVLLVGCVALALAAWLWGLPAFRGRAVLTLITLLLALGSLSLLREAPQASVGMSEDETAYSAERLQRLREEGRAVFVNATAAWCITCKVNERMALSGAEFHDTLKQHGIVYLKADWTRRDPAITALLERFDRAGVPLYLYYAPGAAEPVILPQVLTETLVIDTLTTPFVSLKE